MIDTPLISALVTLPLLTGIVASLFARPRLRQPQRGGIVLHDLQSHALPHLSWIRESVFRNAMANMAQDGNRCVSLTEFIQADRNTHSLLTFDDGFESFYSVAFPILTQYSHQATVFVVAGGIGRVSSGDVFGPVRHLSVAQLQELVSAGFEIGSHGLTHADLTRLQPRELRKELSESRKILEDCTGGPVTAISFPFGSWNRDVWAAALDCGYCCAAAYRGHARCTSSIVPVSGVYAFDSAADIVARATGTQSAVTAARTLIMAQFARGTPLWKFRNEYRRLDSKAHST